MREAFGGTFMIKLMLIFLTIYIAFIAVALNYAKAFRVKNKIIDIIEQNEGISDYNDVSDKSVIGSINTYLNSVSYYVSLDNITASYDEDNDSYCNKRGYCIEGTSSPDNGNGITSKYYKVTTYININFPFFGLDFRIPITGETRKIERINT